MFKNKNKIKIQNTNRKWLHCTMWPHSGAMQKPLRDFRRQKLIKFSLNSAILTGTNASTLIDYYAYYFVHSWHKTYFGRFSLGPFWACGSNTSEREYPEPTWYQPIVALLLLAISSTRAIHFLGGVLSKFLLKTTTPQQPPEFIRQNNKTILCILKAAVVHFSLIRIGICANWQPLQMLNICHQHK